MGGIADKRRGLSEADVLALISTYGLALATVAPPNLAATATVGVATKAAREDHVHRYALKSLYSTGGAQALVPGDIGAEASANKGAANGYAGLDGTSRVSAANAPAKAVYSSGGSQALTPGNIGAAGRWSDELDGSVATVGAVTGVCGAVTVPSDKCLVITATVACWSVAGPEGAGYVLVGTFRRTGGTVTQVGATTVVAAHEDAGLAAAAAALVVNGTNVECQVSGVGGLNLDWRSKIVQKQSPN